MKKLLLILALLLPVSLFGQSVVIKDPNTAHEYARVVSGVLQVGGSVTSDPATPESTCYLSSTASTNSTSCSAAASEISAIHVTNTTSTDYFLRLYNLAAAPTCSSATGYVETIPALADSPNGRAGTNQEFSTGIGFCLTGGGGPTDNTNAATGVYITILYK